MANIDKAFAVENGISLGDDAVGIFTNSTDPSVVGETAPIGSILLRDNGELWIKTSAPATGWELFSPIGRISNRLIYPFTQETSSGTITPYLTTTQKTSDGWRAITTVPYEGTDVGLTISKITVRSRKGIGSGSYDLRVVDLDNGSAVIASVTGLINESFVTTDLGTLSNLPTASSNLEFQTQIINTQNRDVEILWLTYDF